MREYAPGAAYCARLGCGKSLILRAESRTSRMSEPLGGRIHLSLVPSPIELKQARERLSRESCPRRYCWYWHMLAFDWELSPAEGCEVARRHITQLLLRRAQSKPVPAWQQCGRGAATRNIRTISSRVNRTWRPTAGSSTSSRSSAR